jgi:hypothetical protein
MVTRCMLVRLKPGSLERAKEWAATLNHRSEEVLATLKDEGVSMESVFLAGIGPDHYLVYVMQAEDFEKARTVAKTSEHPIDAYHRRFKMDTWLERVELETLIDFSLPAA